MSHRYLEVFTELGDRIDRGAYPEGSALPSTAALAREFDVARGTVAHAVAQLEADRRVSRSGNRWFVHAATRAQDVAFAHSFADWARRTGMTPSGLFVERARGKASDVEARELGLQVGDPVVRIVRQRALDGRPVMVEHTTFPAFVGEIVMELDDDAPSILEAIVPARDLRIGHTENRIDAVGASPADARVLGIDRGTPMLRCQRTSRLVGGRAYEFSDDRYVTGAVEMVFVTSLV